MEFKIDKTWNKNHPSLFPHHTAKTRDGKRGRDRNISEQDLIYMNKSPATQLNTNQMVTRYLGGTFLLLILISCVEA